MYGWRPQKLAVLAALVVFTNLGLACGESGLDTPLPPTFTATPPAAPSPLPTSAAAASPTVPAQTPTREAELPTAVPSPTAIPPPTPTAEPLATPTSEPTATPTAEPTSTPTPLPTATPTPEPTPTLFPFTVLDGDGNLMTFEAPPERIVSFDSAVVEILFAIGEGHRVVGTHEFVGYPPETAAIPKLGNAWAIDLEATVALKPDLVFIFSDGFKADLERLGLTVLYQKSLNDDFRKVSESVRMWGHITGNPDTADVVAARFDSRVEAIEVVVAAVEEGPRVFQDEGDLWSPGPDTLMGEVFRLLKLQNVAHDISGYAQLSPEVIVDRDPELIIASYGDSISGNDAFKDVSAVKSARVFVPQTNALSVAGPRYVEGIEELAKWAYPDLFD